MRAVISRNTVFCAMNDFGNRFQPKPLFRILDENGTPAPYAQFPVQFTVEGSAALVGPQTAVAEGGMTGTYLRTVGTAGEAVLTVSAPQTQPVVLRFTIEKEDAVWN